MHSLDIEFDRSPALWRYVDKWAEMVAGMSGLVVLHDSSGIFCLFAPPKKIDPVLLHDACYLPPLQV